MPTTRKKTTLLDQYSAYYSVICVFGSVVGCVVVPLITQSIESIILSAILISLTAKTIHSRSLTLREEPQDERVRRGGKDGDKRTKKKKPQSPPSRVIDVEVVRRQRQEELLKLQVQRTMEKEQKLEEKRLKKARKREEKLKLKEEEEREKMREVCQRKDREVKRACQKQRRGHYSLDSIDSLVRQPIAARERQNSSGSTRSSRSLPRPCPPRMIPRSCPRALSDSNLPAPPPLPSPSHHPSPPQSEYDSTLPWTKKQRNSVTPSPPHTSPHPPQTHGQVFAVNPLAPSTSVTMAISATNSKATVAKGCLWNEQMYYWSLDQAGLTQPLQYGWDPCHPTGHGLFGNNLQLKTRPNSSQWGSRGPFSAPGGKMSTTPPPPPSPSTFGAIGNNNSQCSPPSCSPTPLPHDKDSVGKDTSSTAEKGYALFSNSRRALFGKSLLSRKESDVGSPQQEKFDEWPVF